MDERRVDSIQRSFIENSPGRPAAAGKRDASLPEAAQSFEAYFILSLLKEMRKTIPNSPAISAR